MQSQLCSTKTRIHITRVDENSGNHYLHPCKAGLTVLQQIKSHKGKMDVLGW